ncbi:cystathionine gamma-synthase family protein [Sphingomonas sp.]|uniref:cystathionine gamma-synthase family protein n=1 Tax=Sphingomonas sp. TaxID=28214 RepID=UPI00286BD75B|nr:cystathionine gamma-synthase family protein [Sphingomonas sp.]
MTDNHSRKPKDAETHIGNHKLDPSTMMMGHGYDPALSEGSLKPPIFLTSTFVFERAADGKHFFEGITGKRPGGTDGLVYSRFNNPNQQILEERFKLWEGSEECLTFSSGMTAITTLFLAFVRPGDVIVHSGPLYAATESIIAKILSQFGIKYVDFPAGATREEIDAALATAKTMGRVSLIYLESPANPTNALVDVEAVVAARKAAFANELPPIAIDNTFLGPLWARPQDQGADISVYSLTKYAGGHSDLVAGGLTGSKALLDKVRAIRNTMGGIIDSNTAWMLMRSLETLELRMSRAGENAVKVCEFFKDHPKVETVGYLGFLEAGSRQKDIYDRHCLGAGSTFSLYLKGGEREAFAFLDALKIAKLAVSLGGTETLASAPAAMTHISVPEERRAALGISDNLVRISIGVEKAEDLIADFDHALNAI